MIGYGSGYQHMKIVRHRFLIHRLLFAEKKKIMLMLSKISLIIALSA